MKKSKFSEEQIAYALREVMANMPLKRGTASATPQASNAASITSVPECPRKAGARPARWSVRRTSSKL